IHALQNASRKEGQIRKAALLCYYRETLEASDERGDSGHTVLYYETQEGGRFVIDASVSAEPMAVTWDASVDARVLARALRETRPILTARFFPVDRGTLRSFRAGGLYASANELRPVPVS